MALEWRVSDAPVDYRAAVAEMEARAAAVRADAAPELVWLLEHPGLYTAGASAKPHDLLDPGGLPVIETRRGGQYTYHGPGQRIGYAVLDLERRGKDLRAHVRRLEAWLIGALDRFGVRGETRADRVGVWVARPEKPPQPDGAPAEDKIAAIGVQVRRWVTLHGVALNVEPDLARFAGVVPCGITGHGVTSLADLGVTASPPDVDLALRAAFDAAFGPA